MPTAWANSPLLTRGSDILVSGAASLTASGKSQTLMIAVDLDNKRMWVRRASNGVWSGSSGNPATNTGGFDITSVVSGNVFPAWSHFNASITTINCGPTFELSIPAGFSAWDATGATTWDSGNKDASITLSNGNRTATGSAGAAWKSVRGTTSHTSGKYVMEMSADFIDANNGWMGGIENASGTLTSYIGSNANGAGAQSGPSTMAFWRNAGSTSAIIGALTKYSDASRSIRSTIGHNAGKFYVELICDVIDSQNGWIAGVTNGAGPLQNFLGSDNNSASFQAQRNFWKNNSGTINILPNSLLATHALCLAIDLTNNRMWGRVDNNAWSGTSGNPATNTAGQDIASVNDGVAVYIGFSPHDAPSIFDQATANFGASSFIYTPPSGFVGWDTVSINDAQTAVSMM